MEHMKILSQLHTNRTRSCRHTKVYLNEMVVRFEDHEDLLSSQAFNVTTITNSDIGRSRWVEFWNADSIRDVVEHIWDRKLEQFSKLDPRIQIRSRGGTCYDMGGNYSWLSPPKCMRRALKHVMQDIAKLTDRSYACTWPAKTMSTFAATIHPSNITRIVSPSM